MNKIVKILALSLLALGMVVAGLALWFFTTYPNVDPAPVISVERTPERIARGRYLANFVTVCIDCHSKRDWTKFAGPLIPGTEGMGGEVFDEKSGGVPGSVVAGNITPAGIRGYSDGELLRSMTMGVTNTNRPLFPLMPYRGYAQLTQEDAYAIVAYLRTLPEIDNRVGESSLDFPVNLIVRTMPLRSYRPGKEADTTNTKEYGAYLTAIAACIDCHTPAEKGEQIAGMEYAGGLEFPLPLGGRTRSTNITPDPETGIGAWSREDFVDRFKAFATPAMRTKGVQPNEFNTPMPWTMYAMMTDGDLGAIYDYLRTVRPVVHRVEAFSPEGN
jgi:mono/diheme cytochrome c family protein